MLFLCVNTYFLELSVFFGYKNLHIVVLCWSSLSPDIVQLKGCHRLLYR